MKKRPDFIKHFSEIQEPDDGHYPGSDELLSIGSPLGKACGLQKFGIHHELLPPGRRTSYPHAEQDEEEFVYVIEGTPQVWIDGEIYDLKPGDFVGFPSGTGICHTFINNSAENVRLLVGGERSKKESKIIYLKNPERKPQAGDGWWAEAPVRPLGEHDGLPDVVRARRKHFPEETKVNGITIRRAHVEDARGIHDAHMRSIQETCAKDYTPEQIDAWGNRPYNEAQRIESILKEFVWVAADAEGIQGFVHFAEKKEPKRMGWFYGLYFTKRIQGKGIGRRLVEMAEQCARHLKLDMIACDSTITARKFYEHLGYKCAGPQANHVICNVGISCLPMEKILS